MLNKAASSESWLRRFPLAKSSCAKIRNLMSVLFNHACRYELFDRNPIHLVRQGAKRRRPPTVLIPGEIKMLVDSLDIRERTLVLLAVSTGLRQSDLLGLAGHSEKTCDLSSDAPHAGHRHAGARDDQGRAADLAAREHQHHRRDLHAGSSGERALGHQLSDTGNFPPA